MAKIKRLREPRSEGRLSEVVDVAAGLFFERGYDATSVQDVADALGILKGSLYHYIDTKEDLLYAIVEQVHTAILQNIDENRALETDAITRLRAFIDAHVALLIQEQIKLGVFLHDLSSLSQDRRRTVAHQRARYADYITELIQDGQREGTIRYDIEPRIATLGLLGMLNWMYRWYRSPGPYTRTQVTESLADMALRGLATTNTEIPTSSALSFDPAGGR